jgi:hypothetical protein
MLATHDDSWNAIKVDRASGTRCKVMMRYRGESKIHGANINRINDHCRKCLSGSMGCQATGNKGESTGMGKGLTRYLMRCLVITTNPNGIGFDISSSKLATHDDSWHTIKVDRANGTMCRVLMEYRMSESKSQGASINRNIDRSKRSLIDCNVKCNLTGSMGCQATGNTGERATAQLVR